MPLSIYISDTIPAGFVENGTPEDVKIKLVRGKADVTCSELI